MPEIFSPTPSTAPARSMSAESPAPSRERDGASRSAGDFAATLKDQIRQRRESESASSNPQPPDDAPSASPPAPPKPATDSKQAHGEVPASGEGKESAVHEGTAPGTAMPPRRVGNVPLPVVDERDEAGQSAASNADPGKDLPAQIAAAGQAAELPIDPKAVARSDESESADAHGADGLAPAGSDAGVAVGAMPGIPINPPKAAPAPTVKAAPAVSLTPSSPDAPVDPANDGVDAQRADPSEKHRAPPQFRAEAQPRFAPPEPAPDGERRPPAGAAADGESPPLGAPQGPATTALRPGPAAAAQPPAAAALVSTPPDQPGFADEVGQKVVLFAGRGESKAELVLTPPHLGRVEVTLTVGAEQTTAQFVAATTAARDALEQALPRLREMFAQAGIELGQSSVGTQSERNGQDGQRGSGYRSAGFGQAGDSGGPARWVRQGNGLIDTFA